MLLEDVYQTSAPFGWGWLAGLAGQPPHIDTIHMNQSAVLLSHINELATIRSLFGWLVRIVVGS